MSHAIVSVLEAEALLREADPLVLDMRDAASYARGHLPGAQRLDDAMIARSIRDGGRRRPVLLYCYRGNTSRDMARLLAGMGFTGLHELAGGWEAWARESCAAAAGHDSGSPAMSDAAGFTP